MVALLTTPGMAGLVANMVAALAVLLVVNIPAPWLGLEFEAGTADVFLAPPGWLVVGAWLVLFPAMGAAHWLVVRGEPALLGTGPSLGLMVLALLCASYVYYTLLPAQFTGIPADRFGLAGNAVVIVLALAVAARLWPLSVPAAGITGLVALWTGFASISVVQLVWQSR